MGSIFIQKWEYFHTLRYDQLDSRLKSPLITLIQNDKQYTVHCNFKFWNKIYFDRVFQATRKEIRLRFMQD